MEKLELIEKKKKKSFEEIFKENKTVIYSVLFYVAGLICGSMIYVKCKNEQLDEIINAADTNEFLVLFINNLGLYFLVFAISVLLGICLVGFPFIHLMPLALGFQAGLKVSYFYINFGFKGFGYSLLMIAPFICSFLTVIIFTISISYELSKQIYDITITKKEVSENIKYKVYLKKYLIYAAFILLVALINTGVTTALSGIITI